MQDAHAISDLRDRPDFLGTVADRLWQAWWRKEGLTLDALEAMVAKSLGPEGLPFCLVAHRDPLFLGTASVIADDLRERPAYSPWLAAVWVEADRRKAGIGASLVKAATDAAFSRLPIERLYLNAVPAKSPFYGGLGWTKIEGDVGGLDIFAMDRPTVG